MTEPGTRWEYGIIDFVGKAIEAVTKRLDAYLRDHMSPSAWPTPLSRSARSSASGWLARTARGPTGRWCRFRSSSSTIWNAGGTVPRASTYIRFCQMILNKGTGSDQVLKPETVGIYG